MKFDTRSLSKYRNGRAWFALAVALLLLVVLGVPYLLQPSQVSRLLLDRAGKALGLEITASGAAEYRLLGTPTLVLRDLVARERGATTALLRAQRLHIALPWSTIRARGGDLVATRLELDQPVLDLPALQHWLATRPPSEKRLPTLSHGLRIRDGRIVNDDASGNPWSIDGIDVDLPLLAPDQPMHARLRGRYLDAPLAIPVRLSVTIMRPDALIHAQATGFAAAGQIAIERDGDWRLPANVILSGPLMIGGDDLRLTPARLGVAAQFNSGTTALPFALGLHGPLHFDEATWSLAPASLVMRGRGSDPAADPIPTLGARGTLALGHRLALQLDGTIAEWPAAWPALPPPLAQSPSPLPFVLRYDGTPELSQIASLQLRRGDTRFQGRFRLQDLSQWIADSDLRSLLPPLDGSLDTPRLEIAGAQLEGVQIELDDPAVAGDGAADEPHDQP